MTIFEFKDYKTYVQYRVKKNNLRGDFTGERTCDLVLQIDFLEVSLS